MATSIKLRRSAATLKCLAIGGLLCAFGVTALLNPLRASAVPSGTILTGQWNYNTTLGFIPLGSDIHCLTKKDVENFNRGICLKHYTCTYDTALVRDGKVDLKGTWTEKNGHMIPVTAKGDYTPETFEITVNGQGMSATIKANRTNATCTTG
jgi:hypothetical protein